MTCLKSHFWLVAELGQSTNKATIFIECPLCVGYLISDLHKSEESDNSPWLTEPVNHGSEILILVWLLRKSEFVLLHSAILGLSQGLEKCRDSHSPKMSNSGFEPKLMPFQYSEFTYMGLFFGPSEQLYPWSDFILQNMCAMIPALKAPHHTPQLQ